MKQFLPFLILISLLIHGLHCQSQGGTCSSDSILNMEQLPSAYQGFRNPGTSPGCKWALASRMAEWYNGQYQFGKTIKIYRQLKGLAGEEMVNKEDSKRLYLQYGKAANRMGFYQRCI